MGNVTPTATPSRKASPAATTQVTREERAGSGVEGSEMLKEPASTFMVPRLGRQGPLPPPGGGLTGTAGAGQATASA